MPRFQLSRPSPALIVSTIALIVATGGTSYAAFSLPKNSVGTNQLKKSAVTTSKISNGAVTDQRSRRPRSRAQTSSSVRLAPSLQPPTRTTRRPPTVRRTRLTRRTPPTRLTQSRQTPR